LGVTTVIVRLAMMKLPSLTSLIVGSLTLLTLIRHVPDAAPLTTHE
jgi:hypothetical protein